MVGDGDAVRIASEIVQNMLGTAEGWLGIDDPVLAKELSEKSSKATRLDKTLERAVKLFLARACSRETGEPGTREYVLGRGDRANGGSTSRNPPPHGYRHERCSERCCDAGARPASASEDGSQ